MYVINGETYSMKPQFAGVAVDHIEPGYYTLTQTKFGFFWSPAEPFQINHKVYGNSIKLAPRILKSYWDRPGIITSALFNGLKGSGKSLLMKRIAMDFVEQGGVVMIINDPFCGTDFNEFVQGIKQPVLFLIDEFEKTYQDKNALNQLLSLLDGTVRTHAMFILTSNSKPSSSRGDKFEFFHNRPSRVYYSVEFSSVDMDAIQEYLDDNLQDLGRKEEVLDFIDLFNEFNMDMLNILVKEVNNNPDLTVKELSEFMNIKPDTKMSRLEYKWQLTYKTECGKKLDLTDKCRGIYPIRLAEFLADNDSLNVMVSMNHFSETRQDELGEEVTHYFRGESYDEYWTLSNSDLKKVSPVEYQVTHGDFTLDIRVHKPKYRKQQTFSLL